MKVQIVLVLHAVILFMNTVAYRFMFKIHREKGTFDREHCSSLFALQYSINMS